MKLGKTIAEFEIAYLGLREVWAARSREEYFLGSPAAAEVTGGGGRQGQLGSVEFGRLGAPRRRAGSAGGG